MPLAKDFFEHTFFKIEHLATVHLENGKFHVHSELQKEGISQDNTHKNTESTSANEVLANHISNEILDFKVYRSEISKMSHTYIEKPAKVFTEAFIPPPEA